MAERIDKDMKTLAIAAALLASCAGAPRDPAANTLPGQPGTAAARVASASIDSPETIGRASSFHGATTCRTRGNSALWVYQTSSGPPRVDTWFTLRGHRGTTPLRSDPPIELAVWLIGHEKLTPPFSTPVAPGCWLLVKPFVGLHCLDRDPTVPLPTDKRTVAWREGPFAFLILRPEPELLGRSLFVQLACKADANFGGVLISRGVEVVVGDV